MFDRRQLLLGGSAVVALVLGGCGSDSDGGGIDPPTGTPTPTPTPTPPTASPLEVRTTLGDIRGRYAANGTRAWTGVPFGQAARFVKSVPAASWNDVRETTTAPANPYQAGGGSEDCLYLNVFAPASPPPAGTSYPVMVWLFGGGNIGGGIGGLGGMYDGSTFAAQGVICVCLNYRVGVFGFLELGQLGDARWPAGGGNNGINDQVLGLKWVRDNIARFGGDAAKVTLGGQSSGAGDCIIVTTLPEVRSRGLVTRAIAQSSGGGQVRTLDYAYNFAAAFVTSLRSVAPGADPGTATAEQVQRAFEAMPTGFGIFAIQDNVTITDTPLSVVGGGLIRNTPLLLGTTRDEWAGLATPAQVAGLSTQTIDRIGFITFPNDRKSELEAGYLPLLPDRQQRNVELISADRFKVPTLQIAQAHERLGGTVYSYSVDYVPASCRSVAAANGCVKAPGFAGHGVDLPLMFNQLTTSDAKGLGYANNAQEQALAASMQGAWVNFVKGETLSVGGAAWVPYSEPGPGQAGGRQTMVFDVGVSRLVSDPLRQERAIWTTVDVLAS